MKAFSNPNKQVARRPVNCLSFCLLALLVTSCSRAPDCPETLSSPPSRSAGCLVIENHRLLVAQAHNGLISIPGGSGNSEEPSHCTAHRETWEETGLSATPTELVRVFDNGFHLYRCRWHGEQSEHAAPFVLEIDKVFWITADEFDQYEWRFPEQAQWLLEQVRQD